MPQTGDVGRLTESALEPDSDDDLPQRISEVRLSQPIEEAPPSGSRLRERAAPINLDDIPAPILGLNKLEQVIVANRAARDLLQLGETTWRGQPIQVLLNFTCSLNEEFRDGTSDVRTHRLHLQRGPDCSEPMKLTIRRAAGNGAIYYICAISSDCSARANEPMVSDQLAAMGQMIAGFAHEVRNPLAALKSIVEDLSAEPEACAAWGKDLSRLNTLVGRLERLVRSSLRLVQSERSNRREHEATALVASALELLESKLRGAPGSITVVNAAERMTACVDESQIVQVLVILLDNALDAAGSADRVRIRIRTEAAERAERRESDGDAVEAGGLVIIDIEDDGPGIPTDILSKIFNPFFTRKPRGTGLGLSIALRLLRENMGRVKVRSSVGKGSVFSVELPGAL